MSTVGAMSGTFATIFSLEKSRKWIIREGLNGISAAARGADRERLSKSRGLRMSELCPTLARAVSESGTSSAARPLRARILGPPGTLWPAVRSHRER